MRFKKWNIGTPAERDVALLRSAGYPYLLSTVLAARGVTTAEAAAEALEREQEPQHVPHADAGYGQSRRPHPAGDQPTGRPSPCSATTTWTASPPRCC